jgi:hypothetical protein
MIAKDYFKRQATTLRKMVRVTRNSSIADRLSLMAEDFDARSSGSTDEVAPTIHPPGHTVDRKDGAD